MTKGKGNKKKKGTDTEKLSLIINQPIKTTKTNLP